MDIGRQLGQLRPANTTAASLFSPVANQRVHITDLIVCNTTGGAVTYRIFHDEDGTTYDETTALYFNNTLGANVTERITARDLFIYMANSSGNIGVRTSSGNAITFTLYGVEYDDMVT